MIMMKKTALTAALLGSLARTTVTESTGSSCECQPTEGYLVTRLWNIVGNLTDQDVIDEFNRGFAPVVTKMEGFQRYVAAKTGNSSTVLFMNQFDTKEHAKAAQEGAKNFTANGILSGNIVPNQFTEDELVWHFDSGDCVTTDSTGLHLISRLYNMLDENLTPEILYKTGESLSKRLKNVTGFVSYSGALSTPNYDKVFVYNIFEDPDGAEEANNMGTTNAATNPNNDVPKNELVVTTAGEIMFDYLCAAGNAPGSTSTEDTVLRPASWAVIREGSIVTTASLMAFGSFLVF